MYKLHDKLTLYLFTHWFIFINNIKDEKGMQQFCDKFKIYDKLILIIFKCAKNIITHQLLK